MKIYIREKSDQIVMTYLKRYRELEITTTILTPPFQLKKVSYKT